MIVKTAKYYFPYLKSTGSPSDINTPLESEKLLPVGTYTSSRALSPPTSNVTSPFTPVFSMTLFTLS